jgi:hypothetical protein
MTAITSDNVLQELWQSKDLLAQRYGNAHALVQALLAKQNALPQPLQERIVRQPKRHAAER